jgi:hypothetical protein
VQLNANALDNKGNAQNNKSLQPGKNVHAALRSYLNTLNSNHKRLNNGSAVKLCTAKIYKCKQAGTTGIITCIY